MKRKAFSILFAVLILCSILQFTAAAVDAAISSSAPILTVSNIDSTTNRLTWTKINGAKSYIIYLLNEDTNNYEKYGGEMNVTACRDKNLLPNTKYTYKVRAKFSDGSMGKMSEAKSVYTCNYIGRSFENIFSGGVFTEQGEWVYFADNDNFLCKVKRDGTGLKKLCGNCSGQINVIGDYIYYNCDIYTKKVKNGIYKIKNDGSGKQLIFDIEKHQQENGDEFSPSIYNMLAVGDRIYFIMVEINFFEVPSTASLCSVKNDGSDLRYLYGDGKSSLGLLGIADSDLIISQSPYEIDYEGYDSGYNKIYKDKCVIKRISLSGEQTEVLMTISAQVHINCFDGDRIVYNDGKETYGYLLSKKKKFFNMKDINYDGCIINNNFIYHLDQNGILWRVDMNDGKADEIADNVASFGIIDKTIWIIGKDNAICQLND